MAAEDGRPLRADVALLEPAARDPDDARLAGVLEADRDAAAAVFGLAELPLLDLADVLVFGLAELLVLGFADRLLFGSSELLSFGFAEDRVLLLPGLDVAIFNAPFQFAHQVYPGP